ncbi:MAG: amylo-alpha-1,6-glucosidase [Rikenellaceae bacterium]
MPLLKFNQNELVNLEYSLSKEFVSTNRAGGYMSTSVTCCNTRKYHGLVVCPKTDGEEENFVFLSSLDETVIQHEKEFNLAIHQFNDNYEPKGHKYLTDFYYSPTPTFIYRVGGVELKKELLWLHNHMRLLVRYTLCEANSATKLRIKPFMAFRSVDALSKANDKACGVSTPVKNGVKNCLYEGFPELFLQLDTPSEFLPAPDWYYDFTYPLEAERGYECQEDLLSTGYFEFDIKTGQSVILACSFKEIDIEESAGQFERELSRRTQKTEFEPCVRHSARQFITQRTDSLEFVAGYHWYKERPRDLFVSMSGCLISQGMTDESVAILINQMKKLNNGLFSDEAVDTPLWMFVTLQNLANATSERLVWINFAKHMKSIFYAYRDSLADKGISLHDNGLIYAKREGVALTWMNSYTYGKPVVERAGYQVEVNALWYNALCFTLSLAEKFNDLDFISDWKDVPRLTRRNFINEFWYDRGRYLADSVCDGVKNLQIRPNQIIACALQYSMLDSILSKEVITCVERYLLTPKGLRTLSPNDPMFKSECSGDSYTRNMAYHNGTVWPWLTLYYLVSNRKVYGDQYEAKAQEMINSFKEDFFEYGISTISEMCDAVPPYKKGGAVSFAMSVGALLRMIEIAGNK